MWSMDLKNKWLRLNPQYWWHSAIMIIITVQQGLIGYFDPSVLFAQCHWIRSGSSGGSSAVATLHYYQDVSAPSTRWQMLPTGKLWADVNFGNHSAEVACHGLFVLSSWPEPWGLPAHKLVYSFTDYFVLLSPLHISYRSFGKVHHFYILYLLLFAAAIWWRLIEGIGKRLYSKLEMWHLCMRQPCDRAPSDWYFICPMTRHLPSSSMFLLRGPIAD